ncbi:nucleotidyltransferase family protein [Undibacterium sp. SXout7W]|uniref:nucleotidyltransferase family protein n=1 Tax=Undibacterium sp. SXout7W TaxID=3413049 RepID=UPI003BF00330
MNCTGILLAAGRGRRYDTSGHKNKLLHRMDAHCPHQTMVECSAAHLLTTLPDVLAVLRPGTDEIAQKLMHLGCRISICQDADAGMAYSLRHALLETQHSDAWIIALGDMPYVSPATVSALHRALREGADIAVPVFQGKRGNPVGFSRTHLTELLQLSGDQGARRLLSTFPVTEIQVDDPGIHQDVDVASAANDI